MSTEALEKLNNLRKPRKGPGRPRTTAGQSAKSNTSARKALLIILKALNEQPWPHRRGAISAAISAAAEKLNLNVRTVEREWRKYAPTYKFGRELEIAEVFIKKYLTAAERAWFQEPPLSDLGWQIEYYAAEIRASAGGRALSWPVVLAAAVKSYREQH